MGPDWSVLPLELLQATAAKITSLTDYIRFRAVCHSWRSAAAPTPHHLPVQLPWLMLPYDKRNGDFTRLFYDLSSSKNHRLYLPETRGAYICGSSHGWLVLHDNFVASLLNPLTHATIPLPPFTTPPATFMPNDEYPGSGTNGLHPTERFVVDKAILTSSPLDPDCLVFLTTNAWELTFCKIGDGCWTVIDVRANWNWRKPTYVLDLSYSNGLLYTVNSYQEVEVYNIKTPSKMLLCSLGRHHLDNEGDVHLHLVEAMSADVFLIEYREFADGITVYKLSNDEPNMIKVTDIGENVFFLLFKYQALSFSSAHPEMLPGWGRNCICYVSKEYLNWTDLHFNHNIKLVKLDDGTVANITGDFGTYQMRSSWHKSLWLTPRLL